jgi:hypothetical protein
VKATVMRTTARPLDHLPRTSVHSSEFSCGKGITSVHTSRPSWRLQSRGTRRPKSPRVNVVPDRNHNSTSASCGTSSRIVNTKLPGSRTLVSSHWTPALRPSRTTRRCSPSQIEGGGAVVVGAVVRTEPVQFAVSVDPLVPSDPDPRRASREASVAIAKTATTSTTVRNLRTNHHCTALGCWPAAALSQAFVRSCQCRKRRRPHVTRTGP